MDNKIMEHSSSSSEKKTDEANISTLTDQIVFKSSIMNQHKKNNNKNNIVNSNNATITKPNKKSKHQKSSSSSIKSPEDYKDDNADADDDNDNDMIKNNHSDSHLSFRTKDGKNDKVDEVDKLCSRVSEVLILHEYDQKPKKEKEIVDYKKIFFKKNEKELEVFESERRQMDEPTILSSSGSDEDSEDYGITNSQQKQKSLSKVICTLSKIENGCATFVSKDDLIFVLPSFFIPKNLNIGNTYMFKLNELDQANNKINKVNTIHKFYSQDQDE